MVSRLSSALKVLSWTSWFLVGGLIACSHEADSTLESQASPSVDSVESQHETSEEGSTAIPTVERFALKLKPQSGSKLSVCRSSEVPKSAKLGKIALIIGYNEMLRLADEADCEVKIMVNLEDLSLPNKIAFHKCHIAYAEESLRVTQLQLVVDQPFDITLEKCLFRIGLWASERGKYVLVDDSELFVPVLGTLWGNVPGRPEYIPNVPN